MPQVCSHLCLHLILVFLSLPPVSNLHFFSTNPSPFLDYTGLYLRCSFLKCFHGKHSHFYQINAEPSLIETDSLIVYGLANVLVPYVSDFIFLHNTNSTLHYLLTCLLSCSVSLSKILTFSKGRRFYPCDSLPYSLHVLPCRSTQ